MGLITVNAELVNQATGTSEDPILENFRDVFIGLGCLEGEYQLEVDPSVRPVKHTPRRVPVALRDVVKKKIQEMENKGIIQKVSQPSEWISSMVVVKTPKKIRICLDPTDLNKALKRSHYLLPTIEEILPRLHKAKIFSILDAKDGFLQIKMDSKSSDLTTFWTPWGRYKWLRMPFGISSAPEEYQRRLHEILEGLAGVDVVADDIVVFGCGDTDEEARKDHDKNLISLLQRARSRNLKLNKQKVQLRLMEVPYIGHLLTSQGLKADPRKIEAVLKMPTPTSVIEAQRVLGFVNYLAKFLPRLSEICKPINTRLNCCSKGEQTVVLGTHI